MSEQHLGEDLLAMAEGGARLSPEHRASHEAHLRSCTECMAAITETRRVLHLVDALPAPEPGPSFSRSLSARLDAIDAEEASGPWARFMGLFTVPRLSGLAVAMAAVLVAVLLLGRSGDPAPSLETLELAEQLELYEDLDVVENLDVLDDLDAIEMLQEEPG